MKILAIETSCDETSIAIIDTRSFRKNSTIAVLAHNTSSQIKIHQKFGGVVPNLANREHQKNLVPILVKSLKEASLYKEARSKKQELRRKRPQKNLNSRFLILDSILKREQELFARIREHILPLKKPHIDAVAVTIGPGLEPALWVGINFARALATLWDLPLIPINHMEGHIFSALLKAEKTNAKLQKPNYKKIKNYKFQMQKFPAIALLVSGGHTELVCIKGIGKYKIIGETLDDAVGEAFDKTARLLGLRYPGGPEIAKLAEKKNIKNISISLPRPMIRSNNFDFSFSGLKTAVLYAVQDLKKQYTLKDIQPVVAREFQNAAVEVLITKTIAASKKYKTRAILLGGGVSANKKLRVDLTKASKQNNIPLLISPLSLTGDNALMIAIAAFFNQKKAKKNISSLKANAHMRLS
ncbi:MAG: tRNA (adenosine(37)-N6)-threonylcarbamoyltransferase complex transferase subunit TsaD [bacterium]|nr:tRNA (adenosine(37)-N6)-threonylcarbamoyltransferase complex transferase subunit TsaD [bacterium]